MRWDFHGLILEGATSDPAVRDRWRASFASLAEDHSHADPDISLSLDLVPSVPSPPARDPRFKQGDLLAYYLDDRAVTAHFPRFGQLRLDLAGGTTEGQIVSAALNVYGVFEDLVAIGLSPHLRRRGLFLIHAFAATLPPRPRFAGVLLVGGIGTGKTTTGMALLDAGWKLLSNDSPILNAQAEILSYPGLLAAYPETFAYFEATAALAATAANAEDRRKLTVAAESIWPDAWIDRAPPGAVFFPQIEPRADHAVEPIRPPEALRRFLPHAVEQWDREMIPEHLRVLRQLVEAAPAFVLRLGPGVNAVPSLLASVLSR